MANVRRAALELAAACIEEVADQLTAALRDASAHPFPTPGSRPPYSDEAQLPMPEVGDRLSGLEQQEGWTEKEWETRR